MTMLSSEPITCKKCRTKQSYTKVITWNTWLNPEYPANNKCFKCGNEFKYEDIDLNECSPEHREEVRFNKIWGRMNIDIGINEKETCEKCGSDKLSYGGTIGIKPPEEFKNDDGVHVTNGWHECSDCGHKKYQNAEECCGDLYDFIRDGDNEHEYVVRNKPNLNEIMDCFQKEQDEIIEGIKLELIQEGLISTDEEEQKYFDEYFRKLHEKYNTIN